MFQLPAIVSLFIDIVVVLNWITGQHSYYCDTEISYAFLCHSCLVLEILAGIRIVTFLPYIWYFHKQMPLNGIFYIWHVFNVGFSLAKACAMIACQNNETRPWVFVIGCFASSICQGICLNHLKSSASKSDIPLRKQIIFGFWDQAESDSAVDNEGMSSSHGYVKSELFENAKNAWKTRSVRLKQMVGNFIQRHRSGTFTSTNMFSVLNASNFVPEVVAFQCVVNLYLGLKDNIDDDPNRGYSVVGATSNDVRRLSQDALGLTHVVAVQEMDQFCQQYPQKVEFYIPQLVVFLLYGSAFGTGTIDQLLCGTLLKTCRTSTTFGHKMYWFCQSFCQEADSASSLSSLLEDANRTDESKPSTNHSAIHKLLLDIFENSESALQFSLQSELEEVNQDHVSRTQRNKPLQRPTNFASASGLGSSASEIPHFSSYPMNLTVPMKNTNPSRMSLPADDTVAPASSSPTRGVYFSQTILFWDTMCDLGRRLIKCSVDKRNKMLRDELDKVLPTYLPSSTIYSPVGPLGCHRIWKVHVEECFAFSTKERAPMFLCIEVVMYESIPDKKKRIERRLAEEFKKMNRNEQSATLSAQLSTKWLNFNWGRRHHPDGDVPASRVSLDSICSSNVNVMHQSGCTSPHRRHSYSEYNASFLPVPNDEYEGSRRISSPFARNPSGDIGQWTPRHQFNKAPNSNKFSQVPYDRTLHDPPVADIRTPLLPDQLEEVNAAKDHYHSTVVSGDREVSRTSASGTVSPTAHSGVSAAQASNSSTKNDPNLPTIVFRENWTDKEVRIRAASTVGDLPGWRLLCVIVKSGDDLRQEQCAAQLIQQMHHILKESSSMVEDTNSAWLRPYDIISLSTDSGLIEAVPDTVSLDALRHRDMEHYVSLVEFYQRYFGDVDSVEYLRARDNFIRSLAGYCIVCYLLQLKDRHNGNILLDTMGHIIHIDFGFMLGISPGGNMGFEKAPFKLTSEFIDLMDGLHSPLFRKFRDICVKTFMELRRNHHRIILLLEMLSNGNEGLPCFGNDASSTIDDMKKRFVLEMHDHAAVEYVHQLINQSVEDWTTSCYDHYQRCCVGVL